MISRLGKPATSYAVVALVACVAHAPALAGRFLWLDHAHIEDGLALAPVGRWLSLFTQGFAGTGFYRPLMAVSLSLDSALGGAPWLFHATSLLWHAAAAVMVILAAQSLNLSRPAAVLAGALFAVHPATSLVAGAIAFRSEAMITVALLALVVFHRRGRVWQAALALLAGGLTKETALVAGPLVIVALELTAGRAGPSGPKADGRGQRVRLWAAEAAAIAVAGALRLAFAPSWRASFVGLGVSDAVGTRLASLWKSLRFVLLPVDRTLCDAFAVQPVWSLWAILGLAGLVGLAALAHRRRGPALLLALTLLPVLNLVPIMRWWSPHYVYLPLAFAAMLAAEAAVAHGRRGVWVAAAAGSIWAGLSLWDARRFASDESLWRPEVTVQPGCREGQFYLGEVERQSKRLDAAADHYERAVATSAGIISYVDRGAALQNLGVTRMEQNRPALARAALREALALVTQDGAHRRLVHNLAAVELRFGNAAEAVRLLQPEVARPDALPESIFLCARALHQLGREAEAGQLLRRLPNLPGVPGAPGR